MKHEQENTGTSQAKILGIKTTTGEIKNTMDGIKSKMEQTWYLEEHTEKISLEFPLWCSGNKSD